MRQKTFIIVGILLIASCKKKEEIIFPTMEELQGSWVGKVQTDITLHFSSDTLAVNLPSVMDTFTYTYTLNETRRTIDVIRISDTVSQYYGILINEQKNHLMLDGMFPTPNTLNTDFIKQ